MRKLLLLTTFVLMAVSGAWAQSASGACGDNLTWSLNNGTLTISGTGEMYSYGGTIYLPWYKYNESITNVVLENGVTTITGYAFMNYKSLVSITAPSVTKMAINALSGCSSLSTINIPNLERFSSGTSSPSISGTKWYELHNDGEIYLGKCLIGYKGTMPSNYNLNILDGTTEICTSSFSSKTNLKSVTIPSSVTLIGYFAFYNCGSNLTNITFNCQEPEIWGSAFDGTGWYNNLPNGLNYINKVAYRYKGSMPANTTITIQSGTKVIAQSCFSSQSNLVGINIPEGVTTIGFEAFRYCDNLKSITLPASITNCSGAFYSLTSLTLTEGMTVIPASLCSSGCGNVTSITIPSSVKSIEAGAFSSSLI